MSFSQNFTLLTSSILEDTVNLVKCDLGYYYIECHDKKSILRTPDVDDALGISNGKRSPPKSFILFRKSFQMSITEMCLKIERAQISKHATNVWQYIKEFEPHLWQYFKNVSAKATDRYNNSCLKIFIFDVESYKSSDNEQISRETIDSSPHISPEDDFLPDDFTFDLSGPDEVTYDTSRLDSVEVKNLLCDLYPEIS
ncbi:7663_t:CDS:1 [Cetraspora pellucida]|uniref:7663_t:CDS:1 n=1 Tax=Cetraspora pellucida TaxID=1433469 RepID=A0A9N9I3T4_9GLOM|nr:7663_t:CDS:1 [Cetraspora pellucida]